MGYLVLAGLLFLPLLGQDSGGQVKGSPQGKGNKNTPKSKGATPKGPADAVHDVISVSFTSDDGKNLLDKKSDFDTLMAELKSIDDGKPLTPWSKTRLVAAVTKQCKNNNSKDDCAPALDPAKIPGAGVAYVFHLVTWSHQRLQPTYPVSSDWHVYQWAGKDTLKQTGFSSDGNPRMYNKKLVLIVGVDRFKDPATMSGTVVDAYKSTATPGQPENEKNLAALLSALLGISGATVPSAVPEEERFPAQEIFIASGAQPGAAHLPFDMKVLVNSDDHYAQDQQNASPTIIRRPRTNPTGAAADGSGGNPPQDTNNANTDTSNGGNKPQTPAEPDPGVMSCTGKNNSLPCTTTRTFTSTDREWWDVSIGVALPGVRETKYGISNGALHSSVTRHTDFYAMLDLYPFAFAAPKDSWVPHFNVGVPLTGQSLYRPYFGMAESVGGLLTGLFRPQRQIEMPLGLNIFGGVTWMKTQVVSGNPTTAADLATATKYVRVRKAMFGVEIPVSALASKIKSVAGKNANGSGKSTTSSGGGGGGGQ